ncbi:MAG: hypothetical protein JXO22_11610 [Phycisphaerae bacterium]|nr:hypothetical protein [Phycisphaerae bacterium]
MRHIGICLIICGLAHASCTSSTKTEPACTTSHGAVCRTKAAEPSGPPSKQSRLSDGGYAGQPLSELEAALGDTIADKEIMHWGGTGRQTLTYRLTNGVRVRVDGDFKDTTAGKPRVEAAG